MPPLTRHFAICCLIVSFASHSRAEPAAPDDSATLAQAVTIHRDEWGVPHIVGPTDASVVFGMGYAQAEDYFWQLEDTTIRALGRYAEVVGESGLSSDLLNRAFEVVPRSKADFEKLASEHQQLARAYAHGINWYLKHHPETPRRLIQQFEPWMALAIDRHLLLDFAYGATHAGRPQPLFQSTATEQPLSDRISPFEAAAQAAIGSNAWAIGPTKTASGKAMLLINPHQPWFGWGQFYEAHLDSQESIRMSGACFFGSPIPTLGHNEYLGWTYTVSDPDNADAWKVVFDSPDNPLAYRFDDGHRLATEWTESIGVRKRSKVEQRSIVFRKTHHGPLVRKLDEHTYLAANVAGIFDLRRIDQAMGMVRASNLQKWKQAIGRCALPLFNVAYADRQGNILYLYNGTIPIRDPAFDWKSPVDGSTSATEWRGTHSIDELPQVINPRCGYVQNCNTSPFTTTHDENPDRSRFPSYMFEDADYQKRRAQISRKLLSEASDITFDQFQNLAFDTRLYWPLTQLPDFARALRDYSAAQPDAARRIQPYLDHLLDWDCRASVDSTQTTLCVEWYEELHEGSYPGETLKSKYAENPAQQLEALAATANKLRLIHGDWKVPWGKVHRIQRLANKPDVKSAALAFDAVQPSFPCAGTPGPLGIVYTVYSTPSIPFLRPARYAVVGSCYLGVVEFSDRVRAASAVQFGASSDPQSQHYFDQARFFSEQKLKPAWFYRDEVLEHAVRSYHPGE